MEKKLKIASVAIIILFLFNPGAFALDQWKSNFEEAKRIARQENKSILAIFYLLEDRDPSQKIVQEIFSQEEFKKYALENLALYWVGIPGGIKRGEQVKKLQQFWKRFKAYATPAVLSLDATGKELTRIEGYQTGTSTAYLVDLKEMVKKQKVREYEEVKLRQEIPRPAVPVD